MITHGTPPVAGGGWSEFIKVFGIGFGEAGPRQVPHGNVSPARPQAPAGSPGYMRKCK